MPTFLQLMEGGSFQGQRQRWPWTTRSCCWKTWASESCRCKCKENGEAASCHTDTKLIRLKAIPHSARTFLPFSTQTSAAGPTSRARGIHSQHQHSDFLPCSWYWYLPTAKITFWKESPGMLYKIITPGSTLPCVSLHFKMKVRKIARRLTQKESVSEITLHDHPAPRKCSRGILNLRGGEKRS